MIEGFLTSAKRWPVLLWLVHLGVPFAVLVYASMRVVYGATAGRQMWPIVILNGGWLAAGLTVVFTARGQDWLMHRRFQILLSLATVSVTFALCDLVLTVTGLVPTVAGIREKSLIYRAAVSTVHRLFPKQAMVFEKKPGWNVNKRGFRGPDIAIVKPQGTVRLVFLGGSQVFDPNGDNWPLQAGKILSTPNRPVDVINAGIPAHRTADSLGKLFTELWLLEPNVLVLCQAWNDIKYFSLLSPEQPYRDIVNPPPHDWRIEPGGLDRLLCVSSIYRMGRSRFIAAIVAAEGEKPRALTGHIRKWGLQQYKINIELICDFAKNLGVKAVLCKQARLPTSESTESDRQRINYVDVGMRHEEMVRALEQCDRVIQDVANRKECSIIDMDNALSGKSHLFADSIHFSLEGSRQAARLVAERLAELSVTDW